MVLESRKLSAYPTREILPTPERPADEWSVKGQELLRYVNQKSKAGDTHPRTGHRRTKQPRAYTLRFPSPPPLNSRASSRSQSGHPCSEHLGHNSACSTT